MRTKLTSRWQTICVVGFNGSVSSDENRSAHGGVCLCQARRTRDGKLVGRKVNSNGRHEEISDAFAIDAYRLMHWESLGAAR